MKDRDFRVDSKGSTGNYVTSADKAVEAFLKERLLKLIPASSFLGEEESFEGDMSGYVWVVDPIDGTSNFIRDLSASVISAALLYQGEITLGVIYNPYRDEAVSAQKGKGAFLNGSKIRVSERIFNHSHFCTAWSTYDKRHAKACFKISEEVYSRCDDIRRIGSAALELSYLAAGRVDLYFEMRLFPWDFAAAEIIVKEAGGFFGTIGFEKPVYNRPIPIIAANTKENYETLREIILKEVPEIPYVR